MSLNIFVGMKVVRVDSDWMWQRQRYLWAAAVAVVFSPRLVVTVAVLAVVFVVGVVVGGGISVSDGETDAQTKSAMNGIEARLARMDLDVVSSGPGGSIGLGQGVQSGQGGLQAKPPTQPLVVVPANVDAALRRLVGRIVADFVDSWWTPINLSQAPDFSAAVATALHVAFVNAGAAIARTKVVNAVSPVTQTLVRHIYEYRAFEATALPLDLYLERNPRSSFHRYTDSKETNKFLRKLSAHIIMSVMPKTERESPVVFSLLREILATSVFAQVVETYSDPDYINQALITYIRTQQKVAEESATPAAVVNLDTGFVKKAQQGSASKFIKSAVSNPSGDQLFVKVVEARQMPIGQGSYFCTVSFGKDLLRTEKVPSDTHPYWKEDFLFDWNLSIKNGYLRIDVFDGFRIRDEFIGSIHIPVYEILENKYIKDWYAIDTSESRVARGAVMAQLYIETMIISISNLDEGNTLPMGSNPAAVDPRVISPRTVSLPAFQEQPPLIDFVEVKKRPDAAAIPTSVAATVDPFSSEETTSDPFSDARADGIPSTETLTEEGNSRDSFSEHLTRVAHMSLQDALLREDGAAGGFETFLAAFQALEYLQLYRDVAGMRAFVTMDEVRDVYSLYFHSGSHVNVSESTMESFKGAVFDFEETDFLSGGESGVRTQRVSSEALFGAVKREVLEALEMFWVKYQNSVAFQEAALGPHYDKEVVEAAKDDAVVVPPSPPPAPAKPPRSASVKVVPPPVPPREVAVTSPLLPALPFRDAQAVTITPSSPPPPLPLRDTPSAAALRPPPPLPSRSSEEEQEEEHWRQREEEDLMYALALQEQEHHSAGSSMSSSHGASFPARHSSMSISTGLTPSAVNTTTPGKLEPSSVNGGSGRSTPSLAPRNSSFAPLSSPIASEIAIVKEMIMVIERKLEVSSSPTDGVQLLENKLKLQALIGRLSDMLLQAEETELMAASELPTMVHLYNAKVHLTDLTEDGTDNTSRPDLFSRILFSVEVEPASTGASGWVLSRTLTHFAVCYEDLAGTFPKMAKFPFPGAKVRNSGLMFLGADFRAVVCAELEWWIKTVLSDPVLCQVGSVQDLLQSERLMRSIKESAPVGFPGAKPQRSGTVRGQVFGALKSAGSVLKNVAVSTGSAIGNAAAAVAQSAKDEYSESSKLVGGFDAPRSRSGASGPPVPLRPSSDAATGRARSVRGNAEYSSLPTENASDSDLPENVRFRMESANSPAMVRKSGSPTRDKGLRNRSKSPSKISGSVSASSNGHNATSAFNTAVFVSATATAVPRKPQSELTPQELAILLECTFGIIEEVFNLSDPNQWIRQKGLQVVKSVLRNSYGNTLSAAIQSQVDDSRSPEAVCGYLDSMCEALWPNDAWVYSTPEYLAELEASKLNPRTEEQRTDTRIEAKNLLNSNAALLGLDGVQTVVGRNNTNVGLSRFFNMLQHRELNRGLICAIMEALVRSVLSD
ncbi:PXA domain-containing protein [Chytriomyces sp. MP71]|nr:PXA domain-containing protein [Chytriomyces sp. MP71]